MWVKEREPNLSYKGPVERGPGRVRMAGGRDVPLIPIVTIGNQMVVVWFEQVRIEGEDRYNTQIAIDFRHLPGFVTPSPDGTLNQFDMDAWVHGSDNQLKLAILGWRGDQDNTRDIYVLRTGFYWRD